MNTTVVSPTVKKGKKAQKREIRALMEERARLDESIAKLQPAEKKTQTDIKKPEVKPVQASDTKAPEKPGPSGVNVETSRLVRSIGAVILAGGIIALLVWQFGGAELLQLILYVALPLIALFAAMKLISYGTLQLIWNSDLDARVSTYMKGLKGTPVPV